MQQPPNRPPRWLGISTWKRVGGDSAVPIIVGLYEHPIVDIGNRVVYDSLRNSEVQAAGELIRRHYEWQLTQMVDLDGVAPEQANDVHYFPDIVSDEVVLWHWGVIVVVKAHGPILSRLQ